MKLIKKPLTKTEANIGLILGSVWISYTISAFYYNIRSYLIMNVDTRYWKLISIGHVSENIAIILGFLILIYIGYLRFNKGE